MKKRILRKSLVISIMLLFIGISVAASTGTVDTENQIRESNLGDDITPPVTIHSLEPETPDGENGFYVSNVTITLNATDDMSGVNTTYYSINSEPWEVYDEPFLLHEDGLYYIVYFSIDNADNMEVPKLSHLKLDQTPPDIEEVEWETFQDPPIFGIWYCKFTCNAVDSTSGMDRVEMFINGEFYEVIPGAGPIYEFTIEWMGYSHWIFTFKHYDVAGNSAFDSVNGSDIKSYSSSQQSSSQQSSNPLLERILALLHPILTRLLNIR